MVDKPMHVSKNPDALSLNAFDMFKGLQESVLTAIEAEVQIVHLLEGEVLFNQGDQGDSLYCIAFGSLDVSVSYPDGKKLSIDLLVPGSTVGEIAILTGQARTATVKALEDSLLYQISRSSFDRMAALYSGLEGRLAQVMSLNINRLVGAQVIRQLFGSLGPAALKELEQNFLWQHLQSGEILYREGDPADSMAIVINGRLQAVKESAGKSLVVAEFQRGMILGEIGLLTGESRTGTVYAVRDTDLIILTRERFEILIKQYPHVMLEISRLLAERLTHNAQMLAREQTQQISVALVPGSPGVPMANMIGRIKTTLEQYGPVLHLNFERFSNLYPRRNAASSDINSLSDPLIESWLDEQESHHDYLLFETDQTWTPWTARCIGHADTILFISLANETPHFEDIQTNIKQTLSRAQWELVLAYPEEQEIPNGTARWLQERSYTQHHHIRLYNAGDSRRLARRIARRSNGLVLGGGGTRGAAHLGVYQALMEAGLEIDIIGGTSAGALFGSAITRFEDYYSIIDRISPFASSKYMMDYTFPIAALTATRRFSDLLHSNYGETNIEDLWRPFFCVSTNLSSLQPVIHRQGLLWEAVRASIAVPGVFAPVSKDGDLLVDGGIVNNLPIDIMREICESGLVIAVNVSQTQDTQHQWDFGSSISGWRVLLSKLNPFAPPIHVPSLADTLMRTISVVTQIKLRENMALADLIITPKVEHINLLDWESWREGVELGYQAAQHALEGWQYSFR